MRISDWSSDVCSSDLGRDDGLSDIGGTLSLVSLQVTAAIHLTVRKGGGMFEGYLLSSRPLENDTSPRTSGPRLLVFVSMTLALSQLTTDHARVPAIYLSSR